MNVIVLGCGPSGLLAAYAVERAGHNVTVLSKKVKSAIYGAQFLHAPVPGMDLPEPVFVKWLHWEKPESYLKKVYGDSWDGTVSDEMACEGKYAWDLRGVYEQLWSVYKDRVVEWEYSQTNMASLHSYDMDFIINTLPREVLCYKPQQHAFISTKIWALGDNHTHMAPYRPAPNTVIYNGNAHPAWYRASNIFGHCTMEWPGNGPRPPVPGVAAVRKPVSCTCACWPGVHHVGRYGQWRKGVLLHHVYEQTLSILTAPKQGVLFS